MTAILKAYRLRIGIPGADALDGTPTVVVARKSGSAGGGDPPASARLAALGFTVTTSLAATVAACKAFDVVVVDCDQWDAGEHTLFIRQLIEDGQRVLVCGDDSSSTLFYVRAAANTGWGAAPVIGTAVQSKLHHVWFGVTTMPNDAGSGFHITDVDPRKWPGVQVLGTYNNHVSGFSVLEAPAQFGSGTLLHVPRIALAGNDSDTFFRNAVRYLAQMGVAYTLDTLLAEIPPGVGGQTVRPTEGKTESAPWTVRVVDAASAFSQILSDTDGRIQLMGRLADFQVSEDGGAFATIATARVADVDQDQEIASFSVALQDERIIERRATIWNRGNTVTLQPPGVIGGYGQVGYTGMLIVMNVSDTDRRWRVVATAAATPTGTPVALRLAPVPASTGETMGGGGVLQLGATADLNSYLQGDLRPDARPLQEGGNFTFTRWKRTADGVDLGVLTFDTIQDGAVKRPGLTFTEGLKDPDSIGVWIGDEIHKLPGLMWVEWVAGVAVPAVGADVLGYLRPKDYEATDQTPIHVGHGGVQFLTGSQGVRPFQLVKDIYDGLYGADGQKVRYDATALQALIDDPTMPTCWFRITAVANMADWLEENIYKPFGVVPFIDNLGRIAPRKVHMPQGVDPTTLFEFTAAICAEPPAWGIRGRELCSRIDATYLADSLTGEPSDAGFDRLAVVETLLPPRKHDRAALVGNVSTSVLISGLHRVDGPALGSVGAVVDRFAREFFDRFGDGPQYGSVVATSAAKNVAPGDFVRVSVVTYPNPAIRAKGGTRIVQVLNRVVLPVGYQYEWLDAGPNLQPPTAPAIALSLVTGHEKHWVSVALSSVLAGDGYAVEVAASVGQPSATSGLWRAVGVSPDHIAPGATDNLQIGPLPSGTSVWVRAARLNPMRIRSPWSVAQNITTTAYAAPTGLTLTAVNTSDEDVAWANPAGSDVVIQVLLDPGSSQPTRVVAQKQPLSTAHRVLGLLQSTTYAVGVRYADPWGGVSPTTWNTFATGAVTAACPPLRGLGLVVLYDAVIAGKAS